MDITIKGRYENGQVILEETPPEVAEATEVWITFPNTKPARKIPRFGYGKGTFGKLPEDFNEPLDDLKEYM